MNYKKKYKELIAAYEADVQFPEVSGMEHLDMLMTRSEISRDELHLSNNDLERLQKADRLLLKNAKKFYEAICAVADLSSWRRDENVPSTHWWWYLDVIAQMPEASAASSQPPNSNVGLSSSAI